jgi:hypothetical protein
MKLYSDYSAHRTRQVFGDLVALGLIAAWVALGRLVYGVVQNLSGFGERMQSSGSQFRSTMTDIGSTLGGVPLIGSGIRAPFAKASDAAASLEQAGRDQQTTVHQLAVGLGVGIAVVPIATVLVLWLLPRIRFSRAASRVRGLSTESTTLDLLALRALARGDLGDLTDIHPDPVRAWRDGDTDTIRALAALELRSNGVRLRSPAGTAG